MIKIRQLEQQDFAALTDDKSLWDQKKKGREYLEWLTQFKASDQLSLVATLGNEIIGYYVTITVPLKIEDKIVHAYRGGLFVHPDHRKKSYNVLNLLVRALNEEAKKRQGVLYEFPTFHLLKYFTKKIKHTALKPIHRYFCVLRLSYAFESILKNKKISRMIAYFCQPLWRAWLFKAHHSLAGVVIKETYSFDRRFDTLWERASRDHKIISARNAEYLNWRYTQEPGQSYVIFTAEKNEELLGYIILKSRDGQSQQMGIIIDIFGIQDKTITQALLLRALEYFDKEGVEKIELYLSDEYYETILQSMKFMKKSPNSKMSEILIAKCYSSTIQDSIFKNPSNWFITTTDMIIA